MKTIFNNLKPFIVYWVSFVVYWIVYSFETFSYKIWAIAFLAVYSILSILTGYTTDIKKMRWGIILFELKLLICPIIYSINIESSGLIYFASASNIFYSTFFDTINSIAGFILSILLPVLLIGIGFGLRKLKKKK